MILDELKRKINNKKLIEAKGDMLDISIKNIDKLPEKKLNEIINSEVEITEKFDGTKLTLVRNDKDWSENFLDNWIVAYKNQILHYEEFDGLDSDKIKKHSVGISQYKIVFDHLKKVHNKTKSIPKNTEFFIEFIQNKLTTTRDYKNKHGLYLIAYSPLSSYAEIGGMLKTNPTCFCQDEKLKEYAKMLELNLPPVIFKGYLNSLENIEKGIVDKNLLIVFERLKSKFDGDIVKFIKKLFLEFESTIGGKPEGVVIKKVKDNEMVKIVQQDQYDKELRLSKKLKYLSNDKEINNKYYQKINELSDKILNELEIDWNKTSYRKLLEEIKKKIYFEINDKELYKEFKFFIDKLKEEKKLR
jgi:hypothetical protein